MGNPDYILAWDVEEHASLVQREKNLVTIIQSAERMGYRTGPLMSMKSTMMCCAIPLYRGKIDDLQDWDGVIRHRMDGTNIFYELFLRDEYQ